MRENVTILKQRAALDRLTLPVKPLLFRVPEPCPAAILDCRTIHGILGVLQETFFERLPAREGRTSIPQNSSLPVPRFKSGGGLLNHTGGTYSHGGMIDYTRFPISELHLGKMS